MSQPLENTHPTNDGGAAPSQPHPRQQPRPASQVPEAETQREVPPPNLSSKAPPLPVPGAARLVRRTWTRHELTLAAVMTWIRARIWGLVFAFASDGVSTIGTDGTATPLFRRNRLPDGPLIIVANHASHADSAVITSTLGRDRRPILFAAAADYWLGSAIRKLAGEALIGLWAVRRGPGGRDDLLAAAEPIRDGLVLVIYPQGTRKTTNQDEPYKTGAFALAKETKATILPIALAGTANLLPKNGRYKRNPVEARWGELITPEQVATTSLEDLAANCKTQIDELNRHPAQARPGFGWSRASRIATAWLGLAIVFFWAYGEGISWPLVAEMPLLLLVVTCGLSWRAPLLIATSAVASVLGILTTWWLVTHGYDPPTPLTTPAMEETALGHMQDNPATAFWHQMFNGIPVKVYANAAGNLGLDLGTLAQVVFPRALRIVIVGGTAWALSSLLARYLRPSLGVIQAYALALFPVALALVVAYWS